MIFDTWLRTFHQELRVDDNEVIRHFMKEGKFFMIGQNISAEAQHRLFKRMVIHR